MNGHFPLPVVPVSTQRRRESIRLLLALLASCLLHAALIWLPYTGTSHRTADAEAQVATPRVFSAGFAVTQSVGSDAQPAETNVGAMPAASESKASDTPPAEQTEGANLLPLPAPIYYTTDRLTKRPQTRFIAELETPETKPLIASGKIYLRLWIDDQGKVVDVQVDKSDLPAVFSYAAISAFRQSRFVPGELNGLPVGSIMRIEVSYDDSRKPEASVR